MEIKDLSLAGLKLILPKIFRDSRGFFLETFQEDLYRKNGIISSFVQDNHSFSTYGVIRGMHFQTKPGQAKLIRVAMGKIYDVVVDIRPTSPTFGRWEGVYLDDEMHSQLFVPIGFAHGFCVMSKEAHVMYKVSSPYFGPTENGFRFDDRAVGIHWPITHPIVSERDLNSPSFSDMRFA